MRVKPQVLLLSAVLRTGHVRAAVAIAEDALRLVD
jgi:hypothetical protein